MRKSWRTFLQRYLDNHFQIERVLQRFLKDGTFLLDEHDEILNEKAEDARTRKFYSILALKDESKLDVFVSHLRMVGNAELANDLEVGIAEERSKLRDRSTSSTPPGNTDREIDSRSQPSTPAPNGRNNNHRRSYNEPFTFDNSSDEDISKKLEQLIHQQQKQLEDLKQQRAKAKQDTKNNGGNIDSTLIRDESCKTGSSPPTPGNRVASLIADFDLAEQTVSQGMSVMQRLQVDSGAPRITQTTQSGTGSIPPDHARLLSHLLASATDGSDSDRIKEQPRRPAAPRTWGANNRQQLRSALFKAIDKCRYCDASVKEPLCDRIESWLTSGEMSSGESLNSPSKKPALNVLTLLFIGPQGTGKHKVLKSIVTSVLRCDCYNDVSNLIDQYSAADEGSSQQKQMAVLCCEGFHYDSAIFGNSSSPEQSPSGNVAIAVNAAVNAAVQQQCHIYVQRFKEQNARLKELFNSENQRRQRSAGRSLTSLLYVVMQDIEGLFDYVPKGQPINANRHRTSSASTMLAARGANDTILCKFQPHPKKVFSMDFFNNFSDGGIIVFAPIASRFDELAVIARDLNAVSASLEQQSFSYLRGLVENFVDRLLPQFSSNETSSSPDQGTLLSSRRGRMIRQLLATLWSSVNNRAAGEAGHRLKVELFKNYHKYSSYGGKDRGQAGGGTRPTTKRSSFLRLFGCASNRRRLISGSSTTATSDDEDGSGGEDLEMLEELRRLVRSKGPLSRKCYQTLSDLLSQLLDENAERLQTCDFVVKLQLVSGGKNRKRSSGHGRDDFGTAPTTDIAVKRFQFGLADAKQQQYHTSDNNARNGMFFNPSAANREDTVDGSATTQRQPGNRGSVGSRMLNCAAAPDDSEDSE